jgi:hypothetical protein
MEEPIEVTEERAGMCAPLLVQIEMKVRVWMRQWCAGNVKICSCLGVVREFRKGQTEVLEEGTNTNVTNGPVRPALWDSIFSVVESGDRSA